MKIHKGDDVVIIYGKDKRKKGKVEKAFPKEGKVVIPGINVVKKHQKAKSQKEPGGILEITKPIFASKVKLVCPKCSQPTRVGFRLREDKKKVRYCKKCKEDIE